jgi:cytidyltransferase-like protein
MKVLGIVVEYNPFHNGHLYHLEQAKKICGAERVVCVMSGNFIQRGEPAIMDKWARTEAALCCGADLVIELPVVYAMSSAEYFAYGAVKILDSLGIVDCICFGSESGNIRELDLISEILVEEPKLYINFLKHSLDTGISFPMAREKALKEYLYAAAANVSDINSIMDASNNILGIEYLKALKKLGSRIEPYTIKRTGSGYNETSVTGNISSATAIRKLISELTPPYADPVLEQVLPKKSLDILKCEFEKGRGPVYPHHFERIILSKIRSMGTKQIKNFPYVAEGLENRITKAASNSGTYEELVEKLSTKRYPSTRIQRILFGFLTDMSSLEFDEFNRYGGPQYARILGFNKNGQKLIQKAKKHASIPLVTKTANFKNTCNPLFKRMMDIESLATDIYVLGFQNPAYRKAGQEYTRNIIRI